MKKKCVRRFLPCCLFLFLCYSHVGFGQSDFDTILYDGGWKVVDDVNFASYYRVISVKNDSGFISRPFTDYYITGEKQSEGRIIDVGKYSDETTIFDGPVVAYYKNGQRYFEAFFKNGKYDGDYVEYGTDGNVHEKIHYREGLLDGEVYVYVGDGCHFISSMVNGQPENPYYTIRSKKGKDYRISYNGNTLNMWKPQVSGRKNVYRNGDMYMYYEIDSITYAICLSEEKQYGRWFMAQIVIINNSLNTIDVDETKFSARIVKTSYFSGNRDTSFCSALSYDNYLQRVKNQQGWELFWLSFAEGMSAASSSYTTTHSQTYTYSSTGTTYSQSTSSSYNPLAATIAYQSSQKRLSDFESGQWETRKAISEGYLKRNTVFSGEVLKGYLLFERPRHYSQITIKVSVGDIVLDFDWASPNK